MDIQTRICGIPCQARVTRYFVQPPLGPQCDSDWDCHGYTDIEFEVLDRRGRPAPWLAAKLTDKDESRIKTQIIEEYESERECI